MADHARSLAGDPLPYLDHVTTCFDWRPVRLPDAVFDRAAAEESLLQSYRRPGVVPALPEKLTTYSQAQRAAEPFARPRTLLGEHLAAHPLDAIDCRALARQFAKFGVPQLPVFRSILRHWQGLEPRDPTVIQLLSTYAVQNPAPDGEVSSLVAHPAFSSEEQLRDIGLLRQLADLLLLRHRTQRSAFHVPDPIRLEEIGRAHV